MILILSIKTLSTIIKHVKSKLHNQIQKKKQRKKAYMRDKGK